MFELKHPPRDVPATLSSGASSPGASSPGASSPSASSPGEGLTLSCTRGGPAPEGLAADALALLDLPEPIKERFGEILRPYLYGQPNEEQGRDLEALCDDNDLDPQRLVPAIKAARFLVTAAARTGLSRDGFTEDLARLDDDPRVIRQLLEVLLPCFEQEGPRLRGRLVERTLAEHGKLVEEANWRVDKIIHSEHADGINLSVAVLSFVYRDGDRRDRITLHLLPEQLNALKKACLQLLPDDD